MITELAPRTVATAANSPIRYATGRCTLGAILVARSGAGLCAVLFGDDDASLTADLAARFADTPMASDETALAPALETVVRLVDARGGDADDVALDMGGTPFQRRVWQVLRDIPVGQTASYADVAARIGAPKAVRAVARACAANRLAVLVPCHRVVRADGSLSGYRWGIARKAALLARESGR